jgi:predicted amidohydrolase YtcJ
MNLAISSIRRDKLKTSHPVFFTSIGLFLALFAVNAWSQDADTIFLGEHIITVDEATQGAQAVAVKGERILAVGDTDTVLKHKGKHTRVVRLGDRALLPGFIDTHGHFSGQISLLNMAQLSPPPVGTVTNIADLQAVLSAYIKEKNIAPGDWVVGFGYDDSLLKEGRHPDRNDLDAVTTEHPVFLAHASGHLGAVNSMALEKVEINASSEDPDGGVIRRISGSLEPDGVLEETAAFAVYFALPQPGEEQSLGLLKSGQMFYASMGITTAQEGAASAEEIDRLTSAGEQGRLVLDINAFQRWTPGESEPPELNVPAKYRNRFKTGGVKLILDGSPQGKTAYLSEPYFIPPHGQGEDYAGYPAYPDETVNQAVAELMSRRIPLQAHANGDAAAEQLINAVEQAVKSTSATDMRTVMIHAQTVRDDQLDRMAELGMIPSFFSAHTFFWGDWHRDSVFGAERAERISPTRSALDRGIVFTVHNDAPVTPPDPIDLIWNTVNRRTRSGDILGATQRIGVLDAIRAVTINGAFQYFEENDKGSITAGKLADLVVLSASPLEIEASELRSIDVVETISHGQTVFSQDNN